MPGLTSRAFGSGNQRWLGSTHALRNARSSHLVLSNFTEADHYPDGYIPSGLPVNAANEADLQPWTGGAGEQLGFIVTDQAVPVGGDEGHNVAVLRHGTINVDHLPVDFTVPEGGVPNFVFVGADAYGNGGNGGGDA